MDLISHPKVAGARKRSGAQQVSSPQSSQPAVEALRLEKTFGSGSCTAPAVACPHPVVPGLLAYSTGAIVVLYDIVSKQQTAFFSPKPRRTPSTGRAYASIAFSRDGCYLAAGERGVQSPDILIWEVSSSRCLQALKCHKHGVGSLAFSQDGKLLVSTGESYDGQLCVWDWQHGTLLAKQHTQAQVQRACFGEDNGTGTGSLIITSVGKGGHFKVWSLALPSKSRDGHFAAGQAVLTPRPASLRDFRTSDFVGVAACQLDGATAGQSLLYALTQSGTLLTLRPATRTIDKSVSLQVNAAFALAASPGLIACACSAGVVRLFAARTLSYKGTLPRPTIARTGGGDGNGVVTEPSGAGAEHACVSSSAGALFSDAVGCAFDCKGDRLTVVYADRSLMVWDVRNPAKVTRVRSVLSHSGIVWSAALIPTWQASLLGPSAPVASPWSSDDLFGPSSVLCTCGADGTVRLWNVCLDNSPLTGGPLGVPVDAVGTARVTRTLRATIYVDQPGGTETASCAAGHRYAPDAPLPAPGGAPATATKPIALRSLRISPCGRHLAAGDVRGNLRIYNLTTLEQLMLKEAHDAEILSLDYSPPSLDGSCYLASASRDMLVHVYDMSRGYELVGTCDAHTGAVTAVRFSAHNGRLALLSCSADKSVVFRFVQLDSCGVLFETYHIERKSRGVLYDIAVDPAGGRAVTVGNDKQLRLFDVATGRLVSSFGCDATCGEAVAVALDPTGNLAVCSCSDGSIAIYDLVEGTLLARGSGHSDVCTGAVLLEDYRGLVTVGGDGCALVWRLPARLAQRMQEAAAECRKQLEQQAVAQAAMVKQHGATPVLPRRKAWETRNAAAVMAAEDMDHDDEPQQVHVDMTSTLQRVREGRPILSVEKLPKWAQLSLGRDCIDKPANVAPEDDSTNAVAEPAAEKAPAPGPAGKWAIRVSASGTAAPAPAPASPAAPPPPVSPAAETHSPAAEAVVVMSMAARAAALAEQPRTWAEAVEEDDEIVFCDALDEDQLPGAPQEVAQDADGCPSADATGSRGCALVSPGEPTLAALVGPDDGQGHVASKEPEGVSGLELDLSGLQLHVKDDADDEALEGPASGCASNRMGGPAAEEDMAGDDIKRDLFKEHFDSLGIDQSSATKPPDPRRLSFTHLYRQARASGAGAQPDLALLLPPRPGSGAGASGTNGGAAPEAAGPTTPYLAKVPLPPAINATRGGTSMAGCEQDGAVTSAWTPERAMLPLTSPALLNADKQLRELDRIRLRLESSIRKKRTNDSAALGTAQSANPSSGGGAAAAINAMPPRAPSQAGNKEAKQQEQQQQQAALVKAAMQAGQACSDVPACAGPAPTPVPAPLLPPAPLPALPSEAADAQARDQTSYGGGTFLLLPPRFPVVAPRQLPVPPPQLTSPPGSGVVCEPIASPGFSSLSTGTPMLGQRFDEATPCARPRKDADNATADGEPANVFVLNPMFGATPGTPVFGLALGPSSKGPQPDNQKAALLGVGQMAGQPAPQSAEDVIRAVLGSAGISSSQEASSVCVVTKDGIMMDGFKKQLELRPQPQLICDVKAEEPETAEILVEVEKPVTGQVQQQQQQRRPKQVLPPIRPKSDSPAKAQAAVPVLMAMSPKRGPGGDQGAAPLPMCPPDVPSDDMVSQLDAALRNVASTCRNLQAGGGVQAATAPGAAVQLCQQAYKAMAAMADLFAGVSAMAPAPVQFPGVDKVHRSSAGSEVPLMVACPSPRVLTDALGPRLYRSRPGPGGSQTGTPRSMASVVVSGEVTSSQVVLEMGMMESMVEQMVHQHMAEERKRMQEDMKRMLFEEMRKRV